MGLSRFCPDYYSAGLDETTNRTCPSPALMAGYAAVAGRVFFIDRQGVQEDAKCRGKHEGLRRATCRMCSAVQQLTALGATVQPWLDVGVDCVVAAAPASVRTPSAPSTPTGTGSASVRGISMRAQLILNSKSVMGAGAPQASPAQFAEKHGKDLMSVQSLWKTLSAAADWQRGRDEARAEKKRLRAHDADAGEPAARR